MEMPFTQSGIEQAPGPRTSPQLPQGPELDDPTARLDVDLDDMDLDDMAKTESCGASFFPWHFGHSAF